jgi:hypothetical protein
VPEAIPAFRQAWISARIPFGTSIQHGQHMSWSREPGGRRHRFTAHREATI